MNNITSQRGVPKLSHEGYLYHKEKESSNGTIYWECEWRKQKCCRGRIHTIENAIKKVVGVHTCQAPNAERIEVSVVTTKIKCQASHSTESIRNIISTQVSTLTESASSQISSIQCLKRSVQRERNRCHAPLPVNFTF